MLTSERTDPREVAVSEPDFAAAFNSLPEPHLILTPGLIMAHGNEARIAATGVPRKDFVGRHLFEVFPDNPDDGKATGVANLRASLARVLEHGVPDTMPIQRYDIPIEGGNFEERYWLPLNFPVLSEAGEILWIVHRVEDVTATVRRDHAVEQTAAGQHSLIARLQAANSALSLEVAERARAEEGLRESEDRFRTLSATLPSFIFVTDAEGMNTFTNAVFQQFTGKSAEDLMGVGWLGTLHPEDRDRAENAWATAWQTQAAYDAEYRFHHHAGGYRWFQVRGTPVRDADGKVIQWVGVCNDTQELIDARNALAAANADLERRVAARTRELQHSLDNLGEEIGQREASEAQVRQLQKIEAVGQLTGGIAHDFNNMLAVVIGSLGMAKRRLGTDPARALSGIENAEEGARRAAQLTARLLAFSRQQTLTPELLDPNKLVSNMTELLRRTIGEAVEIETVMTEGVWRSMVDPGQLENALLNLCVNARDAMPDGGKLTIETANIHLDAFSAGDARVEPGQYVVIAVTDCGTGMPPSVIERAFDPFYTTKGVGRGTGLGLSQVYGFVKQSNGYAKIYSEPGEGTTIKLFLPRHIGAVREDTGVVEALSDMPRAADGEAVLVVEDEAGVRLLSVDVLESLGYRVVAASNGVEALELLDGHPPVGLLFTDIVMPGMNGRVLADEARRRRPDLKVLLTTGYSNDVAVYDGTLNLNMALLPKPFTVDALARKVREVFDSGTNSSANS